ncbi:helix-turn-helix domain-containing protein [Sporichthya brevicatena]
MPSLGPRETSRDRLVRAAALLVDSGGGADLTMEAVATAASVSRATAYRHFSSRHELVLHLVLLAAEDLAADCFRLMEQAHGSREKLRVTFDHVMLTAVESERIKLLVELGMSPTPETVQEWTERVLGQVVKDGQAAGELRTDLETDEILQWLGEELIAMVRMTHRDFDFLMRRSHNFVLPAVYSSHEPPRRGRKK